MVDIDQVIFNKLEEWFELYNYNEIVWVLNYDVEDSLQMLWGLN